MAIYSWYAVQCRMQCFNCRSTYEYLYLQRTNWKRNLFLMQMSLLFSDVSKMTDPKILQPYWNLIMIYTWFVYFPSETYCWFWCVWTSSQWIQSAAGIVGKNCVHYSFMASSIVSYCCLVMLWKFANDEHSSTLTAYKKQEMNRKN